LIMGYILLALTYRNLREALEESRSLEGRYRSLFEQSNDAILIRSLDLPFRTLANVRAAQLLGYDLDDLMQLSLTDLAVPEEREEDARVLERLLAGEAVPAYERRLLRSDGQQIVAEINATLTRDEAGRPQYLQSIIRDITHRRETHMRLVATEQRFHALFESTNDGVFLFGLDMINLAVNSRGAAMMGRTPDEIVGRPVMDFVVPEERQQAVNVRDVLLSGNPLPIYERTMLHKDGSHVIVEISAAMVVDDEGRPLYIQSIARDITWRKKMEEQLTYSLKETEQLARTDSLTGLMNRRAVEEFSFSQIQRALRENTPLSVVMLDMDDLKEINDTHGHQAGDKALKHFASLLNHSKRGYDCAGRWAGDEFVLVLPGTRLADAERMSERLQEMMRQQPLAFEGRSVTLGASIGAAELPLKSGLNYSLDDLVRWADTALYAAKQQGKGLVRLHRHASDGSEDL
ncbi:MAG: GGDEF domain-containing protein, partial [Anaerolineae bacterium]